MAFIAFNTWTNSTALRLTSSEPARERPEQFNYEDFMVIEVATDFPVSEASWKYLSAWHPDLLAFRMIILASFTTSAGTAFSKVSIHSTFTMCVS